MKNIENTGNTIYIIPEKNKKTQPLLLLIVVLAFLNIIYHNKNYNKKINRIKQNVETICLEYNKNEPKQKLICNFQLDYVFNID